MKQRPMSAPPGRLWADEVRRLEEELKEALRTEIRKLEVKMRQPRARGYYPTYMHNKLVGYRRRLDELEPEEAAKRRLQPGYERSLRLVDEESLSEIKYIEG